LYYEEKKKMGGRAIGSSRLPKKGKRFSGSCVFMQRNFDTPQHMLYL
jgi:hypothetical protein